MSNCNYYNTLEANINSGLWLDVRVIMTYKITFEYGSCFNLEIAVGNKTGTLF